MSGGADAMGPQGSGGAARQGGLLRWGDSQPLHMSAAARIEDTATMGLQE